MNTDYIRGYVWNNNLENCKKYYKINSFDYDKYIDYYYYHYFHHSY